MSSTKNDQYLIAVRKDHTQKTFSIAKRKISSLGSTGKIVEQNGEQYLSWNYLNRNDVNRSDLDMWNIYHTNLPDFEADRLVSNIRHELEFQGYNKIKVHSYPESHPQ